VVVDEFVGCLLATLFVPAHAGWFVADFVLFRAVDMVKPWPVNVFERRLPGGWGVMGDDVAAGLMAGGLLMGVRMLLP
jgi:phosphatidylglycerophosphatase A